MEVHQISSILSLFKRFTNSNETYNHKDQTALMSINDESILQAIDEVFMYTKSQISLDNHNEVSRVLELLINYDLFFRRIVGTQLGGGITEAEFISEEKLNFAVLMQSYYNSFRVNLIVEIVNHLNDYYNKVMNMIKADMTTAMNLYRYTTSLVTFYVDSLKYWFSIEELKDEFSSKIYKECIDAFTETRLASVNHLRRFISTIL